MISLMRLMAAGALLAVAGLAGSGCSPSSPLAHQSQTAQVVGVPHTVSVSAKEGFYSAQAHQSAASAGTGQASTAPADLKSTPAAPGAATPSAAGPGPTSASTPPAPTAITTAAPTAAASSSPAPVSQTWTTRVVGLAKHPSFNDTINTLATGFATDAGAKREFGTYSLNWSAVVASGRVVGVRLRSLATYDSAPKRDLRTVTVYTHTDKDEAVQSSALISPQRLQAATRALVGALQQAGILVAPSQQASSGTAKTRQQGDRSASTAPKSQPAAGAPTPAIVHVRADAAFFRDIVIGPHSDATVVLSPGQLTAPDSKQVAVHLPAKVLSPLLSPAGKKLVAEVARGTKFAGIKGGTRPALAAPHPRVRPQVDCTQVKCIAITFDDGPSAEYTAGLLDELARLHVHATFFTVGRQVAANPQLVKREVQEGHAVGIHTWSHPDLRKLPPDQITQQIQSTKDAITKAAGVSPTFTRPPYGAVNPTVIATLKGLGQAMILWDVDTEDWKNKDAETVHQRAIAGAHRGSIILMHDIHPYGPQATLRIVPELRAQGYVFVTVPELLGGQMTPGVRYFNQHSHR